MKNRWESPEIFSQYAELECIDYLMRQEKDRLISSGPKATIDLMIDRATGFGVSRDLQSIDTIKELLERRIELETCLEIDSDAKEFRDKLNELEVGLKADFERITASNKIKKGKRVARLRQ